MEPKIFRSPTLGWGIQRYGIFCLEKFNFWHFEGKFVLVIEECVVVFFVAVYLFLLRTGEWEKSNLFLEKKYIFDEKKTAKVQKYLFLRGSCHPVERVAFIILLAKKCILCMLFFSRNAAEKISKDEFEIGVQLFPEKNTNPLVGCLKTIHNHQNPYGGSRGGRGRGLFLNSVNLLEFFTGWNYFSRV